MRKTCLLIGCFGLLALTAASGASPGFSFSRPNTSASAFLDDKGSCEHSAYFASVRDSVAPSRFTDRGPDGQVSIYRPSRAETDDSPDGRFVQCMLKRGYRFDAAGFRTGPLRTQP